MPPEAQPLQPATLVAEPDLEQALHSLPPGRHADTARRITDLFVAGASQFKPRHIALFDRTLGHLIDVLDTGVLADLAQRLAPLRNAPPDVMGRLAGNGAIAVAGPVLARSTLLDDADLVAIASTGSQAHLFAISGRAQLSCAVTDVLVDCGDRDVVRNLAMNAGAELSAGGLAMLLGRAVSVAVRADKLGRRAAVPPKGLRGLARVARADVRARLIDAASPGIKAELEAIEPAADAAETAEHVEAWRVARALKHGGKLNEAQVLSFARGGHVKEMIAALALICDLPVDVARRMMNEDPDAALVLCQAAGFTAEAARAIVEAGSPHGRPSMGETLARLTGLSPTTAQSIVGYWRAYQRAA